MKKLKRKYVKAHKELLAMGSDTNTTESYKIEQLNILMPKYMKLQNALTNLGVNVFQINMCYYR